MNKRIAILGATSHIAKGLISNFAQNTECKLFLFARSHKCIEEFLKENSLKGDILIKGFKDFHSYEYDVIINCVGLGVPNKLKGKTDLIFQLNEEFDNMVISYLDKHPRSRYINFSSGAVYGNNFNDVQIFTRAVFGFGINFSNTIVVLRFYIVYINFR